MRDYFFDLAQSWERLLARDEVGLLNFAGESSDFCRLNGAKVRQIGLVIHYRMQLRLVKGRKHTALQLTLCGEADQDRERMRTALTQLRSSLAMLPDDPYLILNQIPQSSETMQANRLPALEEWTDSIRTAAQGLDLVGFFAAGGLYRGFANSLGQRNWFENYSFNFDWSLYHQGDKAVKSQYGGFDWDQQVLAAKMSAAREQLAVLRQPVRRIEPGTYRVYLAPAALHEIMSLLQWRSFGIKNQRTKASPISHLVSGESQLSPEIFLSEDVANGLAPDFDSFGFRKPPQLRLIHEGRHVGALVSARSGAEYGLLPSGSSEDEQPESLALEGGQLQASQVLKELDQGLYINNLWYMNFSDSTSCRMTGMTRFACFWVEQGHIVQPIEVMRFDDSLYRILGEHLVGLTEDTEMIPSHSTYEARSTDSCRLPGALIKEMRLTL
jgi:predicted Zn-dependent protease